MLLVELHTWFVDFKTTCSSLLLPDDGGIFRGLQGFMSISGHVNVPYT